MKAVYAALPGPEVVAILTKRVVAALLQIPGMSSRVVTFPKVEAEIQIRVKCYDRAQQTVESFDELIESLVDQGIEHIGPAPVLDETVTVNLNEGAESVDSMRRGADLAVTRPKLDEKTNKIVDMPVDPLPAGEHFDNVTQFGAPNFALPGTNGEQVSGRGRVIEQESTSVTQSVPRDKLKGDPNMSHFRVRRPK